MHMQDKLEKYYAIVFGEQQLYHKILEKDETVMKEFRKRLEIIKRIELVLTNDPMYAKTVPRELNESRLAKKFGKDASLAIDIYNNLVAAKNDMSPVRDLMDDSLSPSATSKTATRKSRKSSSNKTLTSTSRG